VAYVDACFAEDQVPEPSSRTLDDEITV